MMFIFFAIVILAIDAYVFGNTASLTFTNLALLAMVSASCYKINKTASDIKVDIYHLSEKIEKLKKG